jgi:hypothetical protein
VPPLAPPTHARREQIASDERPPEQREQRRRGLEAEDLPVADRVTDAKHADETEEDERRQEMTARRRSGVSPRIDGLERRWGR